MPYGLGTETENYKLLLAVIEHGTSDWEKIAEAVGLKKRAATERFRLLKKMYGAGGTGDAGDAAASATQDGGEDLEVKTVAKKRKRKVSGIH